MGFEFIIDSYTLSRGEPAMLEIHCMHCNALVMNYQKDGPGPLLRCYLDRIHFPDALKNLHLAPQKPSVLSCHSCGQLIGKIMIYEKEDRLAFLLVPDSFQIH